MDEDHNGQVSCEEFLQFCLQFPVLLRPPLEMQYMLRKATFGKGFLLPPPCRQCDSLPLLAMHAGVRYWHALSLKRYARMSKRDPFASVIQAAIVSCPALSPLLHAGCPPSPPARRLPALSPRRAARMCFQL